MNAAGIYALITNAIRGEMGLLITPLSAEVF